MSRCPPRLVLAAAIAAAVLTACSDDPLHPGAAPRADVPGRPTPAAASVPGAFTPVLVSVPASMRTGAFTTSRYLTVPANFRADVYARALSANMSETPTTPEFSV